jgi:hypothetical protein
MDSGPLWESARACQEVLADEPWKHYVGQYDTWPDCLGKSKADLPLLVQTAIDRGDATFMRLMARANIDPGDSGGEVAKRLSDAAKAKPAAPRITVSLEPPQVVIDGTALAVRQDGAAMVKILLDHRGDWVSSALAEAGIVRSDRVKRDLPQQVQAVIESARSKGHRIRLAEVA